MKKKIMYLFLFICFFIGGRINTNAVVISTDDVPNSTYIIGNHMFTREKTNNYDGVLTTQHIMF